MLAITYSGSIRSFVTSTAPKRNYNYATQKIEAKVANGRKSVFLGIALQIIVYDEHRSLETQIILIFIFMCLATAKFQLTNFPP